MSIVYSTEYLESLVALESFLLEYDAFICALKIQYLALAEALTLLAEDSAVVSLVDVSAVIDALKLIDMSSMRRYGIGTIVNSGTTNVRFFGVCVGGDPVTSDP